MALFETKIHKFYFCSTYVVEVSVVTRLVLWLQPPQHRASWHSFNIHHNAEYQKHAVCSLRPPQTLTTEPIVWGVRQVVDSPAQDVESLSADGEGGRLGVFWFGICGQLELFEKF